MNTPSEAPCDKSDLCREPGDSLADAAQRDLFDLLSAPVEADAPPLVADLAPPEAPDVPVMPSWETAGHGRMVHMEISHRQPARRDKISADDPCERATRSAAEALDEVTKANLRRLESTLSWLQKEADACRLPPATQLPPVPGLPVMDAMIDRSTLQRTLQRSPPLPAWLKEEHETPPFAPPRRGGELWPHVVKFLCACAIAAPVSYVFAVATSPLHNRLIQVAGVGSPISAQLPPDGAGELQVGESQVGMATLEATPAEERTLISTPGDEPPPLPKPRPAEAANRSGANRAAGDAQATAAPSEAASAWPVPNEADSSGAVPSAAVLDQAAPPQAAPLQPPTDEAPSAAATTGVGEAKATSVTPPAADASSAKKPAVLPDVKLLTERGRQFFDAGDLAAARILFLRAANAGDAAAAVAMGATYDPVVLSEHGVRGVAADLDRARSWYERAKDMGSPEGPRRLEMLAKR